MSQVFDVAPGVVGLRIVMVNAFLISESGSGASTAEGGWVLVDAGLGGSAQLIASAAEARFGPGARPSSIVLTHGHFDHVGALRELADRWDVPVYAHSLEQPYLTGRSSYPPPDPGVGGGAMAWLSFAYPRGPIDLGDRVRSLTGDGRVPGLPGWRWVHTPGHAPGHVSLFRDADQTLIAGDAVVTTRQESLLSVLTQAAEVHGPPAYFTPDWGAAGESVRALAALAPSTLATGHGPVLRGARMRAALDVLARDFARTVPSRGRYVHEPARADERGVVSVPPVDWGALAPLIGGAAVATLAGVALMQSRGRRPSRERVAARDPRLSHW